MNEIKKHIDYIRQQLSDYITNSHVKTLVCGVSGGIDSAICVILARPICMEHNITLYGISIPISTNKPDEIERADNIGSLFCTIFEKKDLTNIYIILRNLLFNNYNDNIMEDKIQLGNIKARLRMMYLYDIARKKRGLVLSTDNYTEYLLGFWTLHGDVGDFGMIQNYWKTEVYEIAKYIYKNELQITKEKDALNSCIEAVPTDGLGITNSDLDQLGATSYVDIDKILKEHLADNTKHKYDPVIIRYNFSKYKRENPFNISRLEI